MVTWGEVVAELLLLYFWLAACIIFSIIARIFYKKAKQESKKYSKSDVLDLVPAEYESSKAVNFLSRATTILPGILFAGWFFLTMCDSFFGFSIGSVGIRSRVSLGQLIIPLIMKAAQYTLLYFGLKWTTYVVQWNNIKKYLQKENRPVMNYRYSDRGSEYVLHDEDETEEIATRMQDEQKKPERPEDREIVSTKENRLYKEKTVSAKPEPLQKEREPLPDEATDFLSQSYDFSNDIKTNFDT